MMFIGKTQGGKVQYRDNYNQTWVEDDRRTLARVTEVHIYTEEEVARELELKVRYSVEKYDDLEGLLPIVPSITVHI